MSRPRGRAGRAGAHLDEASQSREVNMAAPRLSTATVAARRTPPPPHPSLLRGSERCHQHRQSQEHLVMAPKGVPKKPNEPTVAAPVLHPYEMVRLRKCMSNSARLKELGLPSHEYNKICAQDVAGHSDKNQSEDVQSDRYQSGDSESEYDPLQDDNGEGGFIDDDNAKCSKEKTCEKTNNQTTSMHPGGVKFQSRKRVFPDPISPRVTRSKTNIVEQDASLTQAVVEDGLVQHDDNTAEAGVADGITQHGDHNQGRKERRPRGHNMGLGLQRLNRARRGKLPVVITEGNIRPVVPIVASKYATECNIIVRNHVPILTHWKLYKREPASSLKNKEQEPASSSTNKEKEPGSVYVDLFVASLKAKFDIDIEDKTVEKACIEMMKIAVRNRRHRLKEEYFDPFPLHLVTKTSPVKCMTNEQWMQLVELWKSPKKMETCQKNKGNRAKVKYHHTTGSRAYMVYAENLGDKYSDEEPDAFDLFKEFHYSKKKKCYAPTVQEAITQMENKLSTTTEGEESKSAAQVVGEVLAENTKNNKFLQNVGFKNAQPRSSEQKTKAELEAERRENAQLRGQVADLTKKVEESENARIMDREEMKRAQSEMEAKLDRLLSQIRSS